MRVSYSDRSREKRSVKLVCMLADLGADLRHLDLHALDLRLDPGQGRALELQLLAPRRELRAALGDLGLQPRQGRLLATWRPRSMLRALGLDRRDALACLGDLAPGLLDLGGHLAQAGLLLDRLAGQPLDLLLRPGLLRLQAGKVHPQALEGPAVLIDPLAQAEVLARQLLVSLPALPRYPRHWR